MGGGSGPNLSRNSSFCRQNSRSRGVLCKNYLFGNSYCSGLGDRVSLIGSSELVAEVPEASAALVARKKFTMRPVVMEEEEEEEEEAEGKEEVKEKVVEKQDVGVLAVINKYINLSLIENPVFLVLAGSVMLMAVGVPHCLFFLPSHVETVGLPSSDASLLLSVSAIFDLAGRISFGFFLDLNLVPKYVCYSGMMLLSGLAAILLAVSSSFLSIATCMALYGIGSGGWFLMVPLLLAEHLGVENIASSYGLVRLAQSTTNLSGPLVAGALFQKTGKVSASFYFMGTAMLIGGVIVLFLPMAVQRTRAKERKRIEKG